MQCHDLDAKTIVTARVPASSMSLTSHMLYTMFILNQCHTLLPEVVHHIMHLHFVTRFTTQYDENGSLCIDIGHYLRIVRHHQFFDIAINRDFPGTPHAYYESRTRYIILPLWMMSLIDRYKAMMTSAHLDEEVVTLFATIRQEMQWFLL
jgi:hypothetical protein